MAYRTSNVWSGAAVHTARQDAYTGDNVVTLLIKANSRSARRRLQQLGNDATKLSASRQRYRTWSLLNLHDSS